MGLWQFALLCLAVEVAAGGDLGCLTVLHVNDDQNVRLEAHGANAIRVRAVPRNGTFRDDLVSALLPLSQNPSHHGRGLAGEQGCSSLMWDRRGPRPSLSNGNLRAEVGADGRLTFTRLSDGKVLLAEQRPRRLVPAVGLPAPGFSTLDLAFEPVEGERIYGLGQHAAFGSGTGNGTVDNKGRKGLLLAPHDGEILIPIAHSSLGYAFLFNLPSLGSVEYNDSVSYWHADAVLQADFWVATTEDSPPHSRSPWAQLQQAYADATGHSPVYPEWTTGFWQCKLRYSNQSQIMDVAQHHVDLGIPISLMIIDFFNWNDPAAPKSQQNTLGDETLPASCWPDPKQMVDQLKEMGIELMISPYSHSVSVTSHNYAAAEARGLLAKDGKGQPALGYAGGFVYDLYNQEARAYAFDKMQQGYIDQYGKSMSFDVTTSATRECLCE